MSYEGNSLSDADADRLARAVVAFQRVFVIAGRAGEPAEGKLPFNPLNYQVLALLEQEGPLRPSVLGNYFGVAKTTLSAAATALERRGLIEKEPDPCDGRAVLLRLTESGRDVAQAIERQQRKNMKLVLANLPAEDRRVLLSAFDSLTAAVDEVGPVNVFR